MVDLKNMTRKEKVEYIWDYYKVHIIGVIVVIALIVSFIHGQATKVEYVANLTVIGNITNQDKLEETEQNLTKLIVKNGQDRQKVLIDVIPITDINNPQPELIQKFTVKLDAQQIDVMVLDKSMFDSLVKQSALLNIGDVKDINLSSVKENKIEGVNGENKKGIYAVDAENISVFNDMGLDTNNKVLCISSVTKHKDSAVSMFKWLIEDK